MITHIINCIDHWYTKHTMCIVQLDDGYAVQRRAAPFFTREYLDLTGGVNNRTFWFSAEDSVRKYCVLDIETVLAAAEQYKANKPQPNTKPLRPKRVTDIETARVYNKLRPKR